MKNEISKNISKNDVNLPTPFNQKSKLEHGSTIEKLSEKIPFDKHNLKHNHTSKLNNKENDPKFTKNQNIMKKNKNF